MPRIYLPQCLLLLTSLLLVSQVHGQESVICSATAPAKCVGRGNTIVETPQLVPGSNNSTFSLSSPPVSVSDVHLFLNGSALVIKHDFNVSGQTITLLTPLGPNSHDILRAKYQSQFVANTNVSAIPKDSIDEIKRAALIATALLDGSVRPSSTVSTSSVIRNTAKSPPHAYSESQSIQLLTRRLEDHTDHGAQLLKATNTAGITTQGVEGTGDMSSTSNYSSVLGIHRSIFLHPDATTVTPGAIRIPRAITMLQQILDQAGPQ